MQLMARDVLGPRFLIPATAFIMQTDAVPAGPGCLLGIRARGIDVGREWDR